ncbi:MAG: hypothetical protein JWO22_203 [Frankiales bacterium]|nr:hypothetical protein [Frankiales bacterium]
MERRDVVDHGLKRRATLAELYSGRVSTGEVQDASPYLKSAAKRLGVETDRTCPVCRRATLHEVLWVYGDAIGDADGTARTLAEVERLATERPDFAVYDVEVCTACDWNHLVRTWRTGTPGTPAARRTRRREA